MEEAACKQCRGTGIVAVPRGLYSIDAVVACSCGAGSARWNAVLGIMDKVQEEDRQVRIDEANRQLRCTFQRQQQRTDTVPTINVFKIWGSKK
jgi:hypothetical protein